MISVRVAMCVKFAHRYVIIFLTPFGGVLLKARVVHRASTRLDNGYAHCDDGTLWVQAL